MVRDQMNKQEAKEGKQWATVVAVVAFLLLAFGYAIGVLSERIHPEPITPPDIEVCRIPLPPEILP